MVLYTLYSASWYTEKMKCGMRKKMGENWKLQQLLLKGWRLRLTFGGHPNLGLFWVMYKELGGEGRGEPNLGRQSRMWLQRYVCL